MSMVHRLTMFAAVFATTGCQTVDVLTFREDPRSGVVGEASTTLMVVNRQTKLNTTEMAELAGDFDGLLAAMGQCQAESQPSGTAFPAVIAAAAAAYVIDAAVTAASEAVQARVDALRQASIKGYSGVLILDDARSVGAGRAGAIEQCLLLVRRINKRTDAAATQPAAAFLVGVTPRGHDSARNAAAVVFAPLYAQVQNAAAVTRSGQPIDVSIALSVVAIVPSKSGPERREISLGAFTLDSLRIGHSKSWDPKEKPNPGTGLMALPPSTSAALELRMAVVETGSALPDFEKSKAEIQAVRDALGPAIKDAVLKSLPSE